MFYIISSLLFCIDELILLKHISLSDVTMEAMSPRDALDINPSDSEKRALTPLTVKPNLHLDNGDAKPAALPPITTNS